MNYLAALWRNSGFRTLCTILTGLVGSALAAAAGAPGVVAATCLGFSALYSAVKERIVLFPLWRRLFRTGQGAAGDWMSPIHLRKHTRPLPKRLE